MRRSLKFILAISLLTTISSASHAQKQTPVQLEVDLRDAPRRIYHSKMEFPVRPGPFTLVSPKWIPGEHSPNGPIVDVTGVHFRGSGQEIPWRRDDVDLYAFHCNIPAGVTSMAATLDYLLPKEDGTAGSPSATAQVAVLPWNLVVLYPQGAKTDYVLFSASIRVPAGWKFATALQTVASDSAGAATFETISLTRLVDSPLLAGAFFKTYDLSPGQKPEHRLNIAADSAVATTLSKDQLTNLRQLVAETGALFGARHYRHYDFMLALTDHLPVNGLEHHESSDNRGPEKMLLDPDSLEGQMDLLPHEFFHSWNGKYRRPAGLVTPNYQEPMKSDLLWVYEGLTDYMGNILAARTGLRSPDQFRENLAYTAAMLDHRAGRIWRPLQDTATSVQSIFAAPQEWTNWRRTADYYPEGYLIWLEVDSIIRQKSNGQKSLNDFCRLFYGGQSGPPKVIPYKFEDVVSALNQVVPNDWAALLRERLDSKSPHAPTGGITNGGWKLVYTDKKNATMDAREKSGESIDLSFSLGFIATKQGEVRDVIPGSPAYAAGLGPGMRIIAVNGRKWSKDVVRAALRASVHSQQPLSLLAENGEYYSTYQVNYHEGDRKCVV